MARFVEGYGALFFVGEYLGLLLQSADDAVYGSQEVLLAYRFLVMAGSDECSLIAYVGDVGTRESGCLTRQQVNVYRLVELQRLQVHTEYLLALVQVGEVYMYLSVKTSCTQQCLVENVYTVGGGQDDDTRVGAKSVHLGEQLVQCVLALVIASHCGVLSSGTAYGVDLVDEDDAGCFLLGLAEEVAYA